MSKRAFFMRTLALALGDCALLWRICLRKDAGSARRNPAADGDGSACRYQSARADRRTNPGG